MSDEKILGADAAVVDNARSASDSDAASHVAHTPGPWEVQDDEAHYCIRPDGTGWLIASVYKDALLPQSKTGGYPQANAHLIAAAPEMKEALDAVDELTRYVTTDGFYEIPKGEWQHAMSLVNAAIAKAEGRS